MVVVGPRLREPLSGCGQAMARFTPEVDKIAQVPQVEYAAKIVEVPQAMTAHVLYGCRDAPLA